ncbi:50S ribosomal protein L11 methyltransferase [Variovorax terrae]|uniref:50S ribosomal protein L11 methyltransferase n=1 Tax=Variovorax terrae TaxID=2923278 RepID=A0A9X1VVQ1_9BURK|nr:50S ribosomal protein L11 methyltransferase [Variovorax terrae]MCJ0764140.1 50S ribosomal protein L11 methyltransferase [Variovorax terrae]
MSDTESLFSPSEYTAALLLYVRKHAARVQSSRALDMGTGSGVMMATLLALGAQSALGVELEPLAVQATQKLLDQEGLLEKANLVQGDMWAACGDACFDLVVTNLPQFAAEHIEGDGRLASWSAGGADGRRCVDPFLTGLSRHLAPGGLAVMTHNVFLDIGKTQAMADALGLQARVAYCASAPLPAHKLASLSPPVLARFTGQGIHKMGNYWFVDFDLVEISWKPEKA